MKNVLITGGAGFIGSNFVRYLLTKDTGVHIYNLDALTYAGSRNNLTNLPDETRHTFIKGDICDRTLVENIMHQNHIDTIVHFAAETHVDRSILGPGQFVQTNIVGTYTLLDVARQLWLQEDTFQDLLTSNRLRFHHISTDEVFGSLGPDDPPFSEITPYAPNSPYAASKAASDHLVRSYGHTYGLPITITNCSNNYGPFQFPEKLIPLMILNATQGAPLPIYGDGQQIRDWLYVEDHCDAILTVLRKGSPGETYNIGGDNQPANATVVETLCEILDELQPNSSHVPHKSLIEHVKDRPGHDRRYAMDITKIRHELDWRPHFSLEDGLIKTVEWYLTNQEWINKILEEQNYQAWLMKNYKNRGDTK
jgi:dTDP-glucose 4,6-dehydratase